MNDIHRPLVRAAIVAAAIAFGSNALAQNDPIGHETPLNWGHFNGGTPSNPNHLAETSWEINWESGAPNVGPTPGGGEPGPDDDFTSTPTDPKTTATVDPTQSTSAGEATETDELLRHEQYHFDLAYIWSRYLQEEIKKVKGQGATPQEAVDDMFDKIDRTGDGVVFLASVTDVVYDLMTDHGTIPEMQDAWCAVIGAMLDNLQNVNQKVGGEAPVEVAPTGGSTGGGNFVAAGAPTLVIGNLQLDVRSPSGALATCTIEPFEVRGFHMGGRVLLGKAAHIDHPVQVVVHDPSGGEPLLVAMVRTVAGVHTGHRFAGWLEEVVVRDDVASSAPLLHELAVGGAEDPSLGVPALVITLEQQVDFVYGTPQSTYAFVELGVGAATDPADCNGDGFVNTDDIPFFEGLYHGTFPALTPVAGDLDADGDVDVDDGILLFERLFM